MCLRPGFAWQRPLASQQTCGVAAVIACLFLYGCHPTADRVAAPDVDHASWKLHDGTQFDCWVSGDNHAGQRSWIWCDDKNGPVGYRLIGGGQAGDWKPMAKIRVSEDEKQTITADPNGPFGAAEVLPHGDYTVEFRVGTEQFSGLRLQIQ